MRDHARRAKPCSCLRIDVVASCRATVAAFGGIRAAGTGAGQTGTVTLAVSAQQLQILGQDLTPVFEPGAVEILVGPAGRPRRPAGRHGATAVLANLRP